MPPSARVQRITDALNVAKQTLDAAKGPLALVPVPGLSGAASALSALIDIVLVAEGNKGTKEDVVKHIQALVSIIRETADKANSAVGTDDETRNRLVNSSDLKKRVATLEEDLKALMEDTTNLETGCCGFLFSKQNADALSRISRGIGEATSRFQVQGGITVEMLINGIVANIEQLKRMQQEERAERVRAEQERVGRERAERERIERENAQRELIEQERSEREHAEREHDLDRNALEKLPHVNAGYSSALNPTKSGTLKGTRTALLEEITEWSLRSNTSDNDSFIYVLSGGAGTGKSTIAYEMADRLKQGGALGGSFFFVSGASDFNTTTYVVSTIAYQLAHSQETLYPHIAKAARQYLKEGKKGEQLRIDLDHLIIKPLSNVEASHRPIILVFDALDECTPATQDDVIRLLFLFMERLPDIPFPVRIIVTTRPEMEIEAALNTQEFRDVSKPFKLHEIPRGIVDLDIELFFDVRLKGLSCWETTLRTRHRVVKDLTSLAAGLFIYADTVVKFLGKNPRHAAEVLDALLSDNSSDASFTLKNLDRLYIAILQNALNDDKLDIPDVKKYIQPVLGSLALLQDQMSTSDLNDLVSSVPMRFIQDILDRLGSVILKPETDDVKIRMLHASFPQFLIDNNRCTDSKFHINPSVHHHRLALTCLEVMTARHSLKRNICELDDPTVMKSDIPGLHDTVKRFIQSSLRYSCMHWATHVSQCNDPGQDILDEVTKFARTKLLVWVEVLSYMNRLDVAVPALLAVLSWCQVHIQGEDRNEILQLIDDTHRLLLRWYTPINECPEHLYISALPLAPSCMLTIRYNDMPTRRHSLKSLLPRDSTWSACLYTILTDASYCRAVLSPDGKLVVSGSDSGKVCIWDASNGLLKRTLTGHTKVVLCVAWAHDGESVASCSDDGTIRIWNATSGAQVHVQDVKLEKLYAYIAWSQDGTRLAIASLEGLQVWDIVVGIELKKKMTVADVQNVFAISKDLRRAIDCSDRKLRLWDIGHNNGEILKELPIGFYAFSAVFLHGDTQVACVGGNAVLVWDLESGEWTFKAELQSSIYGIAVSQNGNTLASSTSHSTHLFDTKSWDSLGSFQGNFFRDASFSPDNRRLLMSNQMWDLSRINASSTPSSPLTRRFRSTNPIYFVAVSLDGSRVVAMSNMDVGIWSLSSASLLCDIGGKFSGNCAFSPDAQKIALSRFFTIEIMDITTSEPTVVQTISSSSGSITWSPDGHWIAGVAYTDKRTRGLGVFDAVTGKLVKYLELGDFGKFSDLEFSHDNTMLYVKHNTDGVIFKWREGEKVELEQYGWETEKGRRMRLHKDAWIIREEDGKRLCWVEQGNPLCIAQWGNYCVVASNDSREVNILLIEESSVDMTKSS